MNTTTTFTLSGRVAASTSLLLVLLLPRWAVAQPADLGWADNYQLEQLEILVDEARRAIQENRYPDAESLLDQALQINRASNGLYDPSQLALVDQLLETLLLQGKWEEFDQRLDYIGWLNRRINAADADQLAAGLLRQSEWHRAAAGVIQRSQSAWYLIQGKYLNWQAVSVLENRYGRQDPRLTPILYQIALEHYYQSILIERRGTTSYEFKTDGKVIANGWMFSRNESVKRSYRIGRENLQRARDLYGAIPEVPESTDALLQIYQADWEFLYGNNGEALKLYQEAYYKLLEAGIAEPEVERYFNQLVKIPSQQLPTEWVAPELFDGESAVDFSAWSTLYPGAETPISFLQPPFQLPSDDSQSVQVQLKLEVTGNPNSGRFDYGVTGLDIVSTVLDETVVDRVFAELPLLRFRPRLVAGEVTIHDPFLVNYRFARE